MSDEAKLYAPPGFSALTECNGCGTRKGDLIPENFLFGGWFKSEALKKCCCIHDYMYEFPASSGIKGKEEADRAFLNNMVRAIHYSSAWPWLKTIRLRQAKIYYLAVKDFGGPAYWWGKNHESEEITCPIS